MATMRLPQDTDLVGVRNISMSGTFSPPLTRAQFTQDSNAVYHIPLESLRVWNAYATALPGTPAADDLGLVGGTWATGVPSVESTNQASAGSATLYARFQLLLPPEYESGQSVSIRATAGMVGAIADAAATIDFEAYLSNGDGLISGSDLVSTAATSINSVSFAEKTFALDSAGLVAGDRIDVRVAVLVNDVGTGGTVKARIAELAMLLDIKG